MKIKAIISLMFLHFVLSSQEIEWMVGFGGTRSDIAGNILISENGNFHISGYFADDVNFNLSGGENILTPEFNQEYFLCKYNINRELQWGKSLGAALFGTPAISKFQNSAVSCRYLGLDDDFEQVIKVDSYNEDGSLIWSISQDYLNTTNNIPKRTNVLLPSFNERCDSNSYDDPIALLNIEGECIGQIYRDENNEVNGTIVNHTYVSQGAVTNIILSTFGQSKLIFQNMEIDIGEGDILEDSYDIKTYLLSIDSVGNYMNHILVNEGWSQDLSGIQNWYFVDKATSDSEFTYVTGFTRGSFTFGDSQEFIEVPVIQKIGNNINENWSKQIATIDGATNQITSINVTGNHLIVSGIFSGTVDIDIDEISEKYINSGANGLSSYIAVYNKEGDYINHFVYNNLSISDVAVNSDNTLLSFGTYSKDNLVFETSSGNYNLPNFGLEDLFVKKVKYLTSTNSNEVTNFNLEIYPNPILGEFYVKSENLYKCLIYSAQGELIAEHALDANIKKIKLSNKGIIFLRLIGKENSFEVYKVISQ